MPISVFRGKGISDGVKTERNQLEKLILEGNQPDGLVVHVRGVPGSPQGWGARPSPLGVPPYLVSILEVHRRTPCTHIYLRTLKLPEQKIDQEFRRRKPL